MVGKDEVVPRRPTFFLFSHWTWRADLCILLCDSLHPLLCLTLSASPLWLSFHIYDRPVWCVPKTDGARQDGRCCPGNRMEREQRREWKIFLFLVWMFRLSGRCREYVKRAAGTHKRRLVVLHFLCSSFSLDSGAKIRKSMSLCTVNISLLGI